MNTGPTTINGRKCPHCDIPMTRRIWNYNPLKHMTESAARYTVEVVKPEYLKPRPISLFTCELCNHREVEESLG